LRMFRRTSMTIGTPDDICNDGVFKAECIADQEH
jgi:hypothetical protein